MANKINALDALLKSDINITEDVYIERLKTDFTVKAVDADVLSVVTASGATEGLDMAIALIAEAEVDGTFSDVALMEKVGAMSPRECVKKTLLAGEITTLFAVIQKISGFNVQEQIETAKN